MRRLCHYVFDNSLEGSDFLKFVERKGLVTNGPHVGYHEFTVQILDEERNLLGRCISNNFLHVYNQDLMYIAEEYINQQRASDGNTSPD